MAVRNLRLIPVEEWTGYDTFTDPQEVHPSAWVDSLNVVCTPNNNPVALRSPANYNPALSTTNKVISAVQYDRTAGALIFYDINASSGSNVATYSTDGTTNTSRRTGQADARWQSLNVNDSLYRVNGTEFIQYNTNLSAYAVGITAPASAPTASIVAGGSGTLATGVYVSYAYQNTTTGHIGECSAASGLSGPTSGGNNTLRVAVTASAQTGVDKIVLFISEDGGTVRYLLVDSSGTIQAFSNTTGNIDISVADIYRNFNVEETAYNAPPPSGITFISTWKNRIIAAKGRSFYYSGFDQIAAGIPQEAWPPLNVITVPVKSATAKGGIDTPIGWLALSDQDAYLLSGEPTDKIDSGENTLQITEQFDQLGWKLGTRSPLTIVNTPYGTIWLDQNKHLQFWQWEGMPKPLALGIWPDLANIQNTDAGLAMAEATWFGAGGANGGFYVLTAQVTSYSSSALALTPSLFLQLSETSGSTAIDISGNGVNGTYNNSPTLGASGPLSGTWSKAVSLNGVDEDIFVGAAAPLDLDSAVGFSLAVWINPSNVSGTKTIASANATSGTLYLQLAGATLTLKSRGISGTVATSSVDVSAGQWSFVVVTYSGSSPKIYLNGVDVTVTGTLNAIADSGLNLYIGSLTSTSEWFSGALALFELYSTSVLTATEIASLYQARLLTTEYGVNNRCWIIMLIEGPNGLRVVPGPSSIAAQCVFVAKISGKPRCFIGVTDRLCEILDFDLAGAGWAATDRLYFDCVVGNNSTNFNRLHSLRLTGNNAQDAIVRVSDLDGNQCETVIPEWNQGDYLAVANHYGPRHRVSINWPNDDAAKRTIQNMRFANTAGKRVV